MADVKVPPQDLQERIDIILRELVEMGWRVAVTMERRGEIRTVSLSPVSFAAPSQVKPQSIERM